MNIVPNATLLVQMIHAVVAYQIITRLFCRPVVQQLELQHHARHMLSDGISRNTQRISEIAQKRYSQWYTAHAFFVHHKPNLTREQRPFISHIAAFFTAPTNQEIDTLVTYVSRAAVQRVGLYGK